VYGFKAPGFTAHRRMVHMLEDAGYAYDSSVFPTSLGLCMEMVSKLAYSKWDMFTAPSSPYRPSIENIFKRGKSSIIELPVATLPFFRTPMHFSYAILGGASYAAISRKFLQWSGRQYANFLFHPLDLVDRDIIKTDAKVYGLDIPDDVKLSLADEMLSFFNDSYDLVTSYQMSVIMNSKI
jgi:peptidoglycan-N-acetylglucosamine deacetylase